MGGGRLTIGSFAGARGRRISWRDYELEGVPAGGVVVIAHGFGEHSGRYEHVAERLQREEYAVYALDHHGHGKSEGTRGRISFADAVSDLDRLVDLAPNGTPISRCSCSGTAWAGRWRSATHWPMASA